MRCKTCNNLDGNHSITLECVIRLDRINIQIKWRLVKSVMEKSPMKQIFLILSLERKKEQLLFDAFSRPKCVFLVISLFCLITRIKYVCQAHRAVLKLFRFRGARLEIEKI